MREFLEFARYYALPVVLAGVIGSLGSVMIGVALDLSPQRTLILASGVWGLMIAQAILGSIER